MNPNHDWEYFDNARYEIKYKPVLAFRSIYCKEDNSPHCIEYGKNIYK
jgi:hypothetical protein